MIKPVFRYTSKIVNNLIEITSAREIILNSYLIPKWEVALRREALIRATHASTAIEGNPLTLEEVSKLAKGRKVISTRRAKQEVLNYLKVLELKLKDNGEIQEELRIMAEECGRIGTITSQLQDITQSEQVSPDKELDINTFLGAQLFDPTRL